jgi:hypothetical protein
LSVALHNEAEFGKPLQFGCELVQLDGILSKYSDLKGPVGDRLN